MARPKMDGLLYFSFDTDFFYSDKRIKRFHSKYGNDGLIFYIYLLTEIYRNGYYISWDEESEEDAETDLRLREGFSKQVLSYLASRSLLTVSTLASSVTVITSPGIQKRYQEAVKGRKRQIEVDSEIWLLSEKDTASCIKVTQNVSFSEKNNSKSEKNNSKSEKNEEKESKIKESKIKESSNIADHYSECEKSISDSGIQIPLNDGSFYSVPIEKISKWKVAFPVVDIEIQLQRMIAWCLKNPNKKKTRRGIERFIVNWLSCEQDKDGQYCSEKNKKNSFINFSQREYDFEELEKRLLRSGREVEGIQK